MRGGQGSSRSGRRWLIGAVAAAFGVLAPTASSAVPPAADASGPGFSRTRVTYQPSDEVIANPERGFHHLDGDCDAQPFDEATLRGYREDEQITQVQCVFYLADFKNGPIAQSALDRFQEQADTVRAAGLKMNVRFAYTKESSGEAAGEDAPPEVVLGHLDQLAPVLERNSDVIAVMQAGFIGAWGEWWYTRHFGDQGEVGEQDWANRKAVVDKLLSVLPDDRMVQLRTPYYKRTMYGPDPLPADQAYDGSARARIGHHNDCFLAMNNDQGTWLDPEVEMPYVEAETRYLPMGGETCQPNPPRSDCPTALDELERFGYSYLNIDYHPDVLEGWVTGGCMPEVQRRLGYRFGLTEGRFPDAASPGGALPLELTLTNQGWAAPYNPRPVDLVLRNTSTGEVHRLPLDADPRHWRAGGTVTIDQTLTLPSGIPAGTYELLLELPDPDARLSDRPEYKIRLANAGVWEAGTGFNDLRHTLTVEAVT